MGRTHEQWNNFGEKCRIKNDFHILSSSLSLSPSFSLPIPSLHLFDITLPRLRLYEKLHFPLDEITD